MKAPVRRVSQLVTTTRLNGRVDGWEYTAPDGITVQAWQEDLHVLLAVAERSPYWVGDALLEGERLLGRSVYRDVVGSLPLKVGSLRQYRWLSSRVPAKVRIDGVSASHGLVVAALPTVEERATWLRRASDNGWTVRSLMRELERVRLLDQNGEAPTVTDTYRVGVSDIADFPAFLQGERVAAIVTDPPWARQHLRLFEALSRVASEVLMPGGRLITLSGTLFLPEVMAALSRSLQYEWLVAAPQPGLGARAKTRSFLAQWRPVLVYSNGRPTAVRDPVVDVVKGSQPDKSNHRWQASLPLMKGLVRSLTDPDDLVADPFLGAGTVGVAALTLGRRFVGADIDPQAASVSAHRLHETHAGLANGG